MAGKYDEIKASVPDESGILRRVVVVAMGFIFLRDAAAGLYFIYR